MGGGALFEAVAFEELTGGTDSFGGTVESYTERFTCRAEIIHIGGGEAIEAARLAGREAYKVKIRSSALAKTIKTSWRMRDTRRNVNYNIVSVDAITDRAFVWLRVEV